MIMSIDLSDHDVGRLRHRSTRRWALQSTELIIPRRPEHDHPVAKAQLRVGNSPLAIFDNQMPFKTKRRTEPLDCPLRVSVTNRRYNRRPSVIKL